MSNLNINPALASPPIDRLRQLHRLGIQLREQINLAGDACCEACGIDAGSDSVEADWCREIVEQGTDPARIIESLNQFLADRN